MAGDKLQGLKLLLELDVVAINDILADVEAGVPGIDQPAQLALLVKLCKAVLNLPKT